jgi:hypothetical protein
MTHQDIIKLAMEYGFTGGFDPDGNLTHDATFVEAVKEAVRREREACAKVCDELSKKHSWEGCYANECAEEIRARGNNT